MKAIDRIVAFLCVIILMASPYRLFGSPLSLWIGCLAGFINLAAYRKIQLPKSYVILILYLVLIPPLVTILLKTPGDLHTTLTAKTFITFTILMLCLNSTLDWKSVLKIYKYCVYFCILIFYIQEVSYFFLNRRLTFYLPFLDNYYSGAGVTTDEFSLGTSTAKRSPSIFLESAHFAQFIMPYVAMKMVEFTRNRKVWMELAFLLFTMLIVRSGCGYLMLLAVILYVLICDKEISLGKKITASILALLAFTAITLLFSDHPLVSYIAQRAGEISMHTEVQGAHSGFLRMFRGYFIYASLPLANQIFGTGAGSLIYFCNLEFDGLNYSGTYMNALQMSLCRGGLIGTILLILFMLKIWKASCPESKGVFFALVAMMLMEVSWLNSRMFFFILIIYCLNRYESSNANKESIHCP